jgi:hypothetical protein
LGERERGLLLGYLDWDFANFRKNSSVEVKQEGLFVESRA